MKELRKCKDCNAPVYTSIYRCRSCNTLHWKTYNEKHGRSYQRTKQKILQEIKTAERRANKEDDKKNS